LIPAKRGDAARDRIILYLKKYPFTVIAGDELMVVAGIQDWPRRTRELRVQFGWFIVTGNTAKEMHAEDEFPAEKIDPTQMRPDDYALLSEEQDREAAHRWNLANSIRKKKASVKSRILEYLRANAGSQVTGEELRYVAGNKTEWARRVRELRTEEGWPVATRSNGRPDLGVGMYVLEADRQSPKHDRRIPDETRRKVLRRDGYRCTSCEWNHQEWNPSDPRHLEIHHVKPHVEGGESEYDNLISLCVVCHDRVHRQTRSSKESQADERKDRR
jgi:5-methylcytosine-specific restriction endonuclease McrA